MSRTSRDTLTIIPEQSSQVSTSLPRVSSFSGTVRPQLMHLNTNSLLRGLPSVCPLCPVGGSPPPWPPGPGAPPPVPPGGVGEGAPDAGG
eukprot:7435912-Alexandrium_andersonii.AAC.1